MSKTRASSSSQPSAVCLDCGKKYGCNPNKPGVSSYWVAKCDVCGKQTSVTEARDFGYLNRDWKKHVRT